MVTIATFNEPDKAKRLKQRFQQAGINADIHNEGHLQAVAFMSRPKANAKVMVDDADFERAQNLMIEWETTDPDVAAGRPHAFDAPTFDVDPEDLGIRRHRQAIARSPLSHDRRRT